MPQRIYIAGPMTGYEHYNVHSFEHAASAWDDAGWCVETPFEANSRVWRKHHGCDFNPRADKCDYGDPILAEMLAEDFAALESTMQMLRESPAVLDHIACRIWAPCAGHEPGTLTTVAAWNRLDDAARDVWRDRAFARMAEDCAAHDANNPDDPPPPPTGGGEPLPILRIA